MKKWALRNINGKSPTSVGLFLFFGDLLIIFRIYINITFLVPKHGGWRGILRGIMMVQNKEKEI